MGVDEEPISEGFMMPPECVMQMLLRACTFRFAGRVDQVGRARAFVAGFLEDHPGADDAVLLVSELAANACAHSASGRPGGAFEVRVVVGVEGWVRVEVEDQGSSWDGQVRRYREPAWAVPAPCTIGSVRGPAWRLWMGDLVRARPAVSLASQACGDRGVDADGAREVLGGVGRDYLDLLARLGSLDHLPVADIDRDVRDVGGIRPLRAVEEQVAWLQLGDRHGLPVMA